MILKFTVTLMAVLHVVEFERDFMTGHVSWRHQILLCDSLLWSWCIVRVRFTIVTSSGAQSNALHHALFETFRKERSDNQIGKVRNTPKDQIQKIYKKFIYTQETQEKQNHKCCNGVIFNRDLSRYINMVMKSPIKGPKMFQFGEKNPIGLIPALRSYFAPHDVLSEVARASNPGKCISCVIQSE